MVDCADPLLVANFWSAALGWPVIRQEEGLVQVGSPERPPILTFLAAPDRRLVKNRLHIDLSPVDRGRDAEVSRLIGLGARHIDIGQGEQAWVVLADPEGNEFCVLDQPAA